MVSIEMCPQCRRNKQKCTPSRRTWVEGGEKQKCDRCLRSGRHCGPNERIRPRPPRRQPPLSGPGPSMGAPVQRELNEASMLDYLDSSGDDAGGGDDKQELRRKLANIDIEAESLKKIQHVIDSLEAKNMQGEPYYEDIVSLKNASARELLLNLARAESLADRVAAPHDIEAAESAYTRIRNVYGILQTKHWHEVHNLLLKMARLFRKTEPLRAENFLWDALNQGQLPRQPRETDLHVLKAIARSLPRTSKDLSDVVQNIVERPTPSHLTTPHPPVQRMLESEYARDVTGNIFQSGHLTDPIMPIVGDTAAIREVLRLVPDENLQSRDLQGRSPLYLAAELRKEHFGLALLSHVVDIPGISRKAVEQFANTRDFFGQTVLGVAICNSCSLEFIEILIDHGAKVDPEILLERFWTPLQMASWLGNLKLVELLLAHGAKPGRIWPGGKTPETLAQEAGHDRVAQQLRAALGG